MPEPTQEQYDAVVIGAGQAGGPLAQALAGAGRRTALIERKHVGGTCVNEGCTPTKTMVASARVAHVVRRAADYGVQTHAPTVVMAQVRERKREIVDSFRSGSLQGIEQTDGLTLIRGEAAFLPRADADDGFLLEVQLPDGTRQLRADQVFLNTGARPNLPKLPGLESVPYLNSTSIMELGELPDHLLIIGGGYIGLEFGQMFRRFGSAVTIVQRSEQLLTREDADIAEAVAKILREDGINVLLNTETEKVTTGADRRIELTVKSGEDRQTLTGSHLLIATGRAPNSAALNLDAVGVATDDRGHVQVNGRLETNVPGIFALGDVKGGPAFTHISYDDFRIVRDNVLHGADASTDGRIIPYTVFMDPQLGRVGLTEADARAQGYTVQVAKLPMGQVARAMEVDETRGLMKAVVDQTTGQILGCAILGIEGGEVATMIQIAMLGKLPYTMLRDSPFSHPTVGESLNNLFMKLGG
jgi:pyruvate/2-oxoglutarate dehydrogenase complex dihydrolipoamide dehydrogenase (E3) component